jgi:hypothetical protein
MDVTRQLSRPSWIVNGTVITEVTDITNIRGSTQIEKDCSINFNKNIPAVVNLVVYANFFVEILYAIPVSILLLFISFRS